MALLEVDRLSVQFGTRSAPFVAVDGVELQVESGEVIGIVGESGSGKSVMSLAIMGLIEFPGRVTAERLLFAERDLLALPRAARRRLLGKDIAMIFQDPMTSLNPCYTVGFQLMETLKVHQNLNRTERRQRALQLLEQVGIPDPASRLRAFPHQLSGGMSQRVVIAMAIACNPRLLIADEPTTALDVTIQAQIMDLLKDLQQRHGMALLLITHDLAVVAESCARVVVMYAGQIVETGLVRDVFSAPRHPYTAALLDALPERSVGKDRLATIPGVVPGQYDRPLGCLLNPRCQFADDRCRREQPRLRGLGDRQVRCHTPLDTDGRPTHD
ncbi:MAG: dipeptide ABC transporter ATP-binding protein [Gammaproteobacteria bacterium]|nr:dipeptide ABC transporter ATP-binding protein [Gammaproteobacteria bacterium]MCP5459277.1 dipeptide ABC transporter ATP-binding protein [Gammaproteobacteria bacterium]